MKFSKVDMMIVFIGWLFIYFSCEGLNLWGILTTECLLKIKFEIKKTNVKKLQKFKKKEFIHR